MNAKKILVLSVVAVAALAAVAARAAPITVPNTFTANTPAKAADVNANFTAVVSGVNGLDTRVSTLEAQSAAWNAFLTALTAQCDSYYRQVTSVDLTTGYPSFGLLPAGFKGHFIAAVGTRGSTVTGDQLCAAVHSPWNWMFGDANGYGRCANAFWAQPLSTSAITGGSAIYAEKAQEPLSAASTCGAAAAASGGGAWADPTNGGIVVCCY